MADSEKFRAPTLTHERLAKLDIKYNDAHYAQEWSKWSRSLGEEDASWMPLDNFIGGYHAASIHPLRKVEANVVKAAKELLKRLDQWGPTDDAATEAARDKLSSELILHNHMVKKGSHITNVGLKKLYQALHSKD